MKPRDLTRALRTVPEKRLCLVELAWELVGQDDSPDMDRAADRLDEVEMAVDEVKQYYHATQRVLWRLRNLGR